MCFSIAKIRAKTAKSIAISSIYVWLMVQDKWKQLKIGTLKCLNKSSIQDGERHIQSLLLINEVHNGSDWQADPTSSMTCTSPCFDFESLPKKNTYEAGSI